VAAPTAALVAAPGALVICTVAGAGVAVGAGFDYQYSDAVTGANKASVNVRAGAAPVGTCSAPISRAAGSVGITVIPGVLNVRVSGTQVSPAGAREAGSYNYWQVAIVAGQTTTLTVTTESTLGALVICNVAGVGVPLGMPRTYWHAIDAMPSIPQATVDVPAGAAPAGSCSAPISRPAGSAVSV